MKAYYIFQQADEETISNILDWMRNQERAITAPPCVNLEP